MPSNYAAETDTQSWGICSCWENGGYRSKNGTIPTCRPIIPATEASLTTEDAICSADVLCSKDDSSEVAMCQQPRSTNSTYWCQQSIVSSDGKICPTMNLIRQEDDSYVCADRDDNPVKAVIDSVPTHNYREQNKEQE